jgi:hypothetical protein
MYVVQLYGGEMMRTPTTRATLANIMLKVLLAIVSTLYSQSVIGGWPTGT